VSGALLLLLGPFLFASASGVLDPAFSSVVGLMGPQCVPFSGTYSDGAIGFPEYTSSAVAPATGLTWSISTTNTLNSVSFTISIWVRRAVPSSKLATQTLIGYGIAPTVVNGQLYLAFASDQMKVAYDRATTVTATVLSGSTNNGDINTWVHWLLSVSYGANSARNLYRNGALVASDIVTTSLTVATHTISLGMAMTSATAATNYMPGMIDEFRLYRGVAFTASQAALAAGNIFVGKAD
jgi:hypothetical protein